MTETVLDVVGERQREIVVTLAISDLDIAEDVIRVLAHMDESVELRRITEDLSTVVDVDTGALTPLQRETVVFAIEKGYYEAPRETDLDELSDALGVSKSAVSQRLCAAERKILTQLSDGLPTAADGA